LHKLRGTFRATRHRDREGEPQPNGRLSATPPRWLTPLQGEYWTAAVQGAPPDLLRLVDGATLAVYCVAAALHQQATEAQAAVELSPDGVHASPYLRIADAAGARLLRAIGELGFSPSSRPKLSSGAKDKGESESDAFWQQFKHLPGNAP
jgi:P27 family predicted phage terminase small subunit